MSSTRREFVLGTGAIGGSIVVGGFGSAAGAQTVDTEGLLSVFANRRTVRRYKPDPVPEEHLLKILDAARRGPTTMNQQPWVFLVVRDPARIEAMKTRMLEGIDAGARAAITKNPDTPPEQLAARAAQTRKFFEGYFTAPVYVAVLVDTELPGSGYSVRHDGPIAAAYLMLAARAFGYGTAYLTDGISDEVTRTVLGIPPKYHRVCITPIGVPDRWPDAPVKRKLEAMIAYESLEKLRPAEKIVYKPF